MGFFAEFTAWIEEVLATYIADNTARMAAILEPFVVGLGVLYMIVWGYLLLAGRVQAPFIDGIRRFITLVLVLGVAIQLWAYNDLIVASFFYLPANLAASLIGSFDYVSIVDEIMFQGDEAGALLVSRGGLFSGEFAFYLAGGAVYILVGATAIYTIFVLTLSRIALSILLAIGPLFVCLLLFETTKRFFESWIAQLANYALVALLAIMASALMMRLVTVATADAVRAAGGIEVSHAVRVCIAAGLTLLVMRQVMPMAAGMASGLALSTFGVVSAGLRWGLGTTKQTMGQFGRGLTDTQTTRWDSWSRKAGYYVRRGAVAGGGWTVRRPNSVRRA